MSVAEHLRRAIRAVKAGRKGEARSAFRAVLRRDPSSETALLWLAYLAKDPRSSLVYIARALESRPRSSRAHAALRWARRRLVALPRSSTSRPRRRRYLASAVKVVAVAGLLLVAVLVGWELGVLRPGQLAIGAAPSPIAVLPTSPAPTVTDFASPTSEGS
ncbi:MAG: hypothetical protein PVH62_08520, partial [Anaerolineae bacterium]